MRDDAERARWYSTIRSPGTRALGDTEIWEFYKTADDARPSHMHLIDFRVIKRQKCGGTILP